MTVKILWYGADSENVATYKNVTKLTAKFNKLGKYEVEVTLENGKTYCWQSVELEIVNE